MADPTPYGAVEADAGGCHLISENYAYALQLILGFAALAGLVVRLVVSQAVNLVCLLIYSFFFIRRFGPPLYKVVLKSKPVCSASNKCLVYQIG